MSEVTAAASAVKAEIDAQSGRFEFFKQSLTLGSVGLAGIAALFTDPARIPTDATSKYAVALVGLSLISIVACAVQGLSVYANLLYALSCEKDSGSVARPPEYFRRGIRIHARIIIIGLFCAWISLTIFAGHRLFVAPTTNAKAALAATRVRVCQQPERLSDSVAVTWQEHDISHLNVTLVTNSFSPRGYNRAISKENPVHGPRFCLGSLL